MSSIFAQTFVSIYPPYGAKAERKGRTKTEVNQIIEWLRGYGETELSAYLEKQAAGWQQSWWRPSNRS